MTAARLRIVASCARRDRNTDIELRSTFSLARTLWEVKRVLTFFDNLDDETFSWEARRLIIQAILGVLADNIEEVFDVVAVLESVIALKARLSGLQLQRDLGTLTSMVQVIPTLGAQASSPDKARLRYV